MSKTTLTTELQRKIVARVRQGAYPETAALSLGVSTATFRRWIRQGESTTRGTYREFYLSVYRAQSCAEIEVTLRVRRLGFFGSLQESLLSMLQGRGAVSVFWNVNAHMRVLVAKDREVVREIRPAHVRRWWTATSRGGRARVRSPGEGRARRSPEPPRAEARSRAE